MRLLSLVNAGELVTCAGKDDELGVVEDGAMLVEDGKVSWVGTTAQLRRKSVGKTAVVDAEGGLVTPGFVDPHTHLLFAGSREDELERKVSGESYTEILKEGGGIARTIRETRRATLEEIVEQSLGRVSQLAGKGVTTVEVKTGYGQGLKDELRLLDCLAEVRGRAPVEVVSTLLGLHATPSEFRRSSDYAEFAVKKVLPAVAERGDRPRFSDCFCEEGVFSSEECRRYLRASKKLGFGLKIHADEFKDSGGAELAAEVGCVSADHLGRSGVAGLEAMGRKKVTAVLLPGTSLYSGIPYADARKLVKAGCQMALGTDLSPNSWVESPQYVMSLACMEGKMTPAQALLGFTRRAAMALGRRDIGTLGVGASADFVVHSLPGHRFLPYRVGGDYVRRVFKGGKELQVGQGTRAASPR